MTEHNFDNEPWSTRAYLENRLRAAHADKVAHLREHELAARGVWPQVTIGCDHVGGSYCQYLDRLIVANEENIRGFEELWANGAPIEPSPPPPEQGA